MSKTATRRQFLIPQSDDSIERAAVLSSAKEAYGYNHDMGYPVAVHLHEDDHPALIWQGKLLGTLEKLRVNLRVLKARDRWHFVNDLPPLSPAKLLEMIRAKDIEGMIDYFVPVPGGISDGDRSRRIRDFRDVFATTSAPSVIDRFDTDEYFAEAMVAGPDPTRLVRMERVPEKFPINSGHLSMVPEFAGETLEEAIAAGRVYWVDHEPMAALGNGKHPQSPKFMYSPMVAFCVPRHGGLMRPFAIQCGQDPVGREIYTPADSQSWAIARNCVLVAHNTYQEVLTHLGFTHLMSEPIKLATVRNLAVNHPVAMILSRHFEGTLYINKLAVDILIRPGRAVDYLIGSDLTSTYSWLAENRENRSFKDNYLPTKLSRSATASSAQLPVFPYRDDGMLIWDAIHTWVDDFVHIYYARDEDVETDWELQSWASEISSFSGGRVRDFGSTPGRIMSREDLAEILTMVIWTAGPQHAAVNFAQKDHYAFLPANPLAGYTPEPMGRNHDEKEWLANLPPLDVAVQQYCIMTLLGSIHHTSISDIDDQFRETAAWNVHQKFVSNLASIDDEINARNRRRPIWYELLRPSLIPNSTNI